MGLNTFTTEFKNISKQECLRLNTGYRYFFDIKDAIIFKYDRYVSLKKILKELTIKKIVKGELEFEEYLIDIGNIERRFNNLINIELVNEIGSDKNILEKGDIIIPKLQPQMGNMFLNIDHKRFIGSTELVEYSIADNYNLIFIYYLITTKTFLKELAQLESGKTHRRVSTSDLLKIRIPEIKKSIQDKIENKINKINYKIKEIKNSLVRPHDIINDIFKNKFNFDFDNADKMKKEMNYISSLLDVANEELKFDISLKYRFIYKKYVKNQWPNKWIKIGRIVKIKGGKRLPKGENVIEDETDYRYIRVEDLNWSGKFLLSNIKFISNENHNLIKEYIVKKNDILLTIVGATIGKCGIVPKELDGINISENFARITIKDSKKYIPEYINYCLQSKICTYQIDEFKGRSSQGKLALFRIGKIEIPDVNYDMQLKIVKEIKEQLKRQEELKINIQEERNKIDDIIYSLINHRQA